MGRNAKAFFVDKITADSPAGAMQITRSFREPQKVAGFQHNCPCGCGLVSFMGIDKSLCVNVWDVVKGSFDDLNSLTLAPSIGISKQPGGGYHWHGFLRDGVFVEE